jgi:hypothetical protein
MLNCNFSYKHYQNTIKRFKEKYTFSNFNDCSTNDIILRHDIDYSLESAVRIAEIENNLNVKSTYFILFHSEMYNIFSPTSIKYINKIIQLGHDIGLHYDASVLSTLDIEPGKMLIEELNLLENHFNTKINVVSAHNPTLNENLKIPHNIINAYDPKFTKERKYLSDSVQFWRENCFCSHIGKYEKLQILTHPIWWSEENIPRGEIMNNLIGGNLDVHKRHIEKFSLIYDDYIKKESLKSSLN